MSRCRVMVFEKPEVIDETGREAHRHTTSHGAGMIDTANVARTPDNKAYLQYRRCIRDNKFMTNELKIVIIYFYITLCNY